MTSDAKKWSSVRWGLAAVAFVVLLLAVLPDWIGVGAPGLGPMQWLLLASTAVLLVISLGLGRVPGRWLLAFFSTTACLGLAAAVLLASQADLPWLWWSLTQKLTGPEQLGIHEHDDLLGWRHRKSRSVQSKHLDFTATYTIDANRMRPTGSDPNHRKQVVLLGGSFTFGHGVNDREAYPSILAREHWSDVHVINAAVNGWGTVQCFLRLEQILKSSAEPPDLVIYGWISHHAHRNANRLSALTSDRKRPTVKRVGRQLVFDRLIDAADGQPDSEELARHELELSVQLVEAMNQRCADRGTAFVCMVLRSGYDQVVGVNQEFMNRLTAAGVAVLDLRSINMPLYPHDGHPTAQGHVEIARQIAAAEAVREAFSVQESTP